MADSGCMEGWRCGSLNIDIEGMADVEACIPEANCDDEMLSCNANKLVKAAVTTAVAIYTLV